MRSLACYALTIGAAAALLAGCALPIDSAQQSSALTARGERGGSWMLPEAKRRDLLYLSRGPLVYVYSYPRGGLVGVLYFGNNDTLGECSDSAGDVFVTASSSAYEFRHGDTKPMATIYDPGGRVQGCSVNPLTGELAISGGENSGPILATYTYKPHRGWRFAKLYSDSAMESGSFSSYDDQGNLYIDGRGYSGNFVFAVLPNGAKTLTNVTLNQSIKAGAQVQWDNGSVAIGDAGISPSVIYQFSISGSTGTEVGSTTLAGSKEVVQFWIQGNKVIGPDPGDNNVGFWNYPAGGEKTKTINLAYSYGATISVARGH